LGQPLSLIINPNLHSLSCFDFVQYLRYLLRNYIAVNAVVDCNNRSQSTNTDTTSTFERE